MTHWALTELWYRDGLEGEAVSTSFAVRTKVGNPGTTPVRFPESHLAQFSRGASPPRQLSPDTSVPASHGPVPVASREGSSVDPSIPLLRGSFKEPHDRELRKMSKKLYVGNMSYSTSHAELEAAFGAFGTVQSVNVITDRDTGRPRGFGFVEMGSEAEAQAAIEGLDGQDLGGRNLVVNLARPREDRSGGGGGGFGGGRRRERW